MSPLTCARSVELSVVLRSGNLPSTWEPSLREHVQTCRQCSDQLLVSQSLRTARSATMAAAPMGSPQLLWWRAQLRRRNEALEKLSKPTSIVGTVAALSTLAVALALLAWQAKGTELWLAWLGSVPEGLHLDSMWSTTSLLLPLSMAAALLVLGGFALYLATDRT